MCFYVKKHLDYKPYRTPSYKVTREAEAVKEKDAKGGGTANAASFS